MSTTTPRMCPIAHDIIPKIGVRVNTFCLFDGSQTATPNTTSNITSTANHINFITNPQTPHSFFGSICLIFKLGLASGSNPK